MSLKKPLVLGSSGLPEQLQTGDALNVPISGYNEVVQTNDEAGAITICMPVYNDVSDGVKKAKADAIGTTNCIGLVADASITNATTGSIATGGIFTATTGQWDAVTGLTGGLTKGTYYFLSAATAGAIVATAPTTAGQFNVCLGIAISTTELKLDIKPRIAL